MELFGGQHVVASTQVVKGRTDMPWQNKCLPHWPISSALTVALLGQWAALPSQQGGWRDANQRTVTVKLLSKIGEAASGQDGDVIRICFDVSWKPRAPRPPDYEAPTVELPLAAGILEVAPLKAFADSSANILAVRAWRIFASQAWPLAEDTKLPLKVLFEALLRTPADVAWAKTIYAQICYQLGFAFEKRCLKLCKSDNPPEAMSCRWATWQDVGAQYQLDHMLVRYCLSCRIALQRGRVYHFVTDAHTGCGPKMANTPIARGNVMALAVPQVGPQTFKDQQTSLFHRLTGKQPNARKTNAC